MTKTGIILYGPPASGKNTITERLAQLDPRFRLFERLKVGSGRKEGYRFVTNAELANLRDAGDIAWENERYGATYAVDTPELSRRMSSQVPVIHLGQPEGVKAVQRAVEDAELLLVEVWCSRDQAERRLIGRGTTDLDDRLKAWDDTPRLGEAQLHIDTDRVNPDTAARTIRAKLVSTDEPVF